jgi:SAM-dependent methyltransferase
MQIEYNLERLRGLQEVDLETVDFETIDACPICAGRNLLDLSQLSGSLVTSWCGGCAHMFHRRRPTHAWYRQWYTRSWDQEQGAAPLPLKSWIEPVVRIAARTLDRKGRTLIRGNVFDFCRPVLQRSWRVLDVGCGYGRDLRPFGHFGCRTFGIEACPHRARAAGAMGIRTVPLGIEELTPDTFGGKFDLVTSNHVLEHVYDPRAFVAGVTRVLNPGGWLCIAVPNVERDFLLHNFFFALHIHCFSRSSLESLLEQHGFVIHRLQEEHQLRLLAQWRPEAPERPVRIGLSGSVNLSAAHVAAGVLGPDYQSRQSIACEWRVDRARMGHVFEAKFTEAPDQALGYSRSMRLRWRGPESLPLQFVSQRTGTAPFWVK